MIDPGMADPVEVGGEPRAIAHDLLRDLRGLSDSAFEDPAALEAVGAAAHRSRRAEAEVRQDPGRCPRIRGRCLTPGLRAGAADRQSREDRRAYSKDTKAELARIGADLSAGAACRWPETIEEEARHSPRRTRSPAAAVSITLESVEAELDRCRQAGDPVRLGRPTRLGTHPGRRLGRGAVEVDARPSTRHPRRRRRDHGVRRDRCRCRRSDRPRPRSQTRRAGPDLPGALRHPSPPGRGLRRRPLRHRA